MHFYGIDFDDVIERRKTILGTRVNETLICGDINIIDLTKYVEDTLPTLFVVAGVFQYFKQDEVLVLIKSLQATFKNAEYGKCTANNI